MASFQSQKGPIKTRGTNYSTMKIILTSGEIKAFREHWKLRQEDLAGHLGVSRDAVKQWEMGRREPPVLLSRALEHLALELKQTQ